MVTVSGLVLLRWRPRRGSKTRRFGCWAGGIVMRSGLTSTPHVTDWQDTQLSWRESGRSNGARVHCICDPVALLCVLFIVCSQFCQVVFCCLITVTYVCPCPEVILWWFSWECDRHRGPSPLGGRSLGWTPRDNDHVIRSQAHTVRLSSPVFPALGPSRVGRGVLPVPGPPANPLY